MRLNELERAVLDHTGNFLCEQIGEPTETKVVAFRHDVSPPRVYGFVPSLPGFEDFYDTFGSITLYLDDRSGDAAVHIADPGQWEELHTRFSGWIEDLDEEEREEVLPEWIDDALVIGEEPHTGNYFLVPTKGPKAGSVYLFDHDGFEFSQEASTLIKFVEKMLDPSNRDLSMIATHMRFAEGDRMVQWWIRELTDSRGNRARTKE
jgi:hypothetical protein